MGTRHLIAVVYNNEYKVAQYGQWDEYPSGQGKDILDFLDYCNLEDFKKSVQNCYFVTKEKLNEMVNASKNWIEEYPQFYRSTGSDILYLVNDSNGPLPLSDNLSFAGDSLFCEWAYVIDLDNDMLEVYQGFVSQPHTGERFSNTPVMEGSSYYPVKLKQKFPIKTLKLNEFLTALEPEEEEE